MAALRELAASKGVRGQFWDFHELMREIKRSFDPETKTTEMQVLDPVVEIDILLLDDLGAWKITDWMNDTLFYILNSRYLARRPTLITTNFQDVSAREAAEADRLVRTEYLVDRIGTALRSRLTEMCLKIPLDGEDFRERGPGAEPERGPRDLRACTDPSPTGLRAGPASGDEQGSPRRSASTSTSRSARRSAPTATSRSTRDGRGSRGRKDTFSAAPGDRPSVEPDRGREREHEGAR